MNKSETLKIAIVSDMHCLHKNESTPSGITYLYSNTPQNPVARHPVYALLDLLNKNDKIRADILICPGDIADKADEQGLITGWDFLQKIQKGLEASNLFATIGNHDVDSRRTHPNYTSAFQMVQDMHNDYPVLNYKDIFWAKKYLIIELEDADILILNTCHNHASKEDSNQSILTPAVLQEIESEISGLKKKKFRFAFCHHHPVKHSNIDIQYKDGDVIDNGDKLIRLLDENDFQIIIHGHKHDPRLKKEYSLAIFAAGSFSSLQNIKELGADNCFHIVELFPHKKQGVIHSWIYAPSRGWEVKSDREFPCTTGFGNEKTVDLLAKECSEIFQGENLEYVKFQQLLDSVPDLRYLMPNDQIKLNKLLRETYGLALVPELPNLPKLLTSLIDEQD